MTPKPRRPRADYSMLRVRSPRNSVAGCGDLTGTMHRWTPAENCYVDGPSFFGSVYLKVPGTWDNGDSLTCRVFPHERIADHVETAMLHEGEWYWIVRRNRGRRA